MIESKIMETMNSIEYGFLDENGKNIIENDPEKWDNEFYDFYYLLSPNELLEQKCGVCWDQVELERFLFEKENWKVKTFFICTYENDGLPSHTFLTYEKNNMVYWFEHSWGKYKGIHEYNTLKELLLDVKKKFVQNNDVPTIVYEYERPPYHISCEEYYKFAEKGTIIRLNEPLYFYHLVNKNANLNIGLLSLQYMFDHNLYHLFDQSVSKYKERIVNGWNKKYLGRDKNSLTREEILDALTLFRGSYGANYIYFFRYPPYKELGPNMEEVLKYKDIYRIDIHDETIQKYFLDIDYGYEQSHSDHQKLDKDFYETITKQNYFSDYNDNDDMIFKSLNHIGIAFKDGYCPISILKKVS